MFSHNSLACLVLLLVPWSMLTEPAEADDGTQVMSPARMCTQTGEKRLKARFGSEHHWLCLRNIHVESSPLIAKKSFLYVGQTKQDLDSANFTLCQGYTMVVGVASSADGYLAKDGQFVGTLVIGNRTFYTNSYDDASLLKLSLKFDSDHTKTIGKKIKRQAPSPLRPDITFDNVTLPTTPSWTIKAQPTRIATSETSPHYETPSTRRTGGGTNSVPIYEYRFKPKTKKKKPPMPGYIVPPARPVQELSKARLCELLVLADYPYYVKDVHSSLELALNRMVHAVSVADRVFRNTDFDEDGMPDNVGFAIKYVVVLTTAEKDKTLFGDLPPKRELDGKDYLTRFAALSKLRDVCLGVAFTGRTFKNGTIGFSFSSLGGGVGGVCHRDEAGGPSLNVLAVAHDTGAQGRGKRVPERLAELVMLHEMGHSFGASHDELFERRSCDQHIMSRDPSSGNITTHMEFSECSRESMRHTIAKGHCLVYDDRSYCGNGIVEGDEACDCGLAWRCATSDRCCTPRPGSFGVIDERSIHVAGCSVAPTALCHPSQGGCCDRHCHFVDFTADGIDCSRMQERCPCEDEQERCQCGLGGECLPDGTCVAVECARLGLRECVCPHHGPGGAVGEAHRCGVCCVLPPSSALSEAHCASAETAASRQLTAGYVTLQDLRDEDFDGPTVFFRLCTSASEVDCDFVSLRAWYKRGACAALGRLGECSPGGVCVPPARPAPNVFPLAPGEPTPKRRMAYTPVRSEAGSTFQRHAIFLVCFNIFCQNIL